MLRAALLGLRVPRLMKKSRSTKRLYIVELVRPPGTNDTDVCYLIRSAVQAEPGSLPPGHPLSELKRETVDVKSYARVLQGMQSRIAKLESQLEATRVDLRVAREAFRSAAQELTDTDRPGMGTQDPQGSTHTKPHVWVPSRLGHGEVMCKNCLITNREAAALGRLNACGAPEKPASKARAGGRE